MEFIRTHVGYFDFVEGGFQAGASWGFVIGVGVMFVMFKLSRFGKRKTL
jgi:hypothetical protein